MMAGMKGLFRTEYDDYFHEYEYLVCISQDEARLNQRALLDNPDSKVFYSFDESEEDLEYLEERHIAHYLIKDIETI